MRLATGALLFILTITAVLGEKGIHNNDKSRDGMHEETRRLREPKKAKQISYHAIVSETIISGKGEKHWKGDDYGQEHGKGNSKSIKKSKKKSKKTKSSKNGCEEEGNEYHYYGKGYKYEYNHYDDDYYDCSPAPSVNPSSPKGESPTTSPTITASPSFSHSPSSKPSLTAMPSPSVTKSVNPSLISSETPTYFPSIIFDLQICASYSRRWLLDLTETCDDTFSTCQCSDAEQKIANGRINCETDRCPPECELCSYCLTNILDCYKDEPSPVPSTVPTTKATKLPSKLPTLSPTTLAPTASFDLINCNEYRNSWTYELMTDGQCKNAKSLVAIGSITCDSLPCPENCSICNTCMNSVLDCETDAPTLSPSLAFDLQNCASYSDRWLRDVTETGQCIEAIERESKGEISCREEDCPLDCPICNECLSQIPCPDGPPDDDPRPSVSPAPVQVPTSFPTAPFELSVCSSYSRHWLLDLTATCGALRSFDDPARTSCVCSDAEEKISDGEITCGTDVCPEDCSLCQFCLYELLDCLPTTGTSIDEVARKAL